MTWPQPRNFWSLQELEEAERIFPWSLRRERPCQDLDSDSWPPELQKQTSSKRPVCDSLSRQTVRARAVSSLPGLPGPVSPALASVADNEGWSPPAV